MNIPKKLRENFKSIINTFFSLIPTNYNCKLINFAVINRKLIVYNIHLIIKD